MSTLMLSVRVNAQNDIQLTQQFLSRVNYNPAATGASNYTNMYLLARQQWIGFKDAPKTQVFNAHSYFNSINAGMGLSVVNDKLGYENSINAKLAYAYHIHFKNESYLSLGLSGGLLYKSLDINKAITENPDDHTLATYYGNNSKLNPDFDLGVEYNTKHWQIGISATHINMISKGNNIWNVQSTAHFYAYTRFTFDLDRDWKFSPGIMGINNNNTYNLEANGMVYYKGKLWFGGSYRTNEALASESVSGIVGLFITENIRLGYSYDFNIGALKKYSGGSHEVMLSLRLGQNESSYGRKSPRFFE